MEFDDPTSIDGSIDTELDNSFCIAVVAVAGVDVHISLNLERRIPIIHWMMIDDVYYTKGLSHSGSN